MAKALKIDEDVARLIGYILPNSIYPTSVPDISTNVRYS